MGEIGISILKNYPKKRKVKPCVFSVFFFFCKQKEYREEWNSFQYFVLEMDILNDKQN